MVQCRARSKRSGFQCKKYAVKGKVVCRIHGAYAGPKTQEGKARIKEANTKHGNFTKEAFQECRSFKKLTEECRNWLSQ